MSKGSRKRALEVEDACSLKQGRRSASGESETRHFNAHGNLERQRKQIKPASGRPPQLFQDVPALPLRPTPAAGQWASAAGGFDNCNVRSNNGQSASRPPTASSRPATQDGGWPTGQAPRRGEALRLMDELNLCLKKHIRVQLEQYCVLAEHSMDRQSELIYRTVGSNNAKLMPLLGPALRTLCEGNCLRQLVPQDPSKEYPPTLMAMLAEVNTSRAPCTDLQAFTRAAQAIHISNGDLSRALTVLTNQL